MMSLKNRRIVVSALKMETEAGQGGYELLHTGVGKVNASLELTKHIMRHGFHQLINFPIQEVINYGTAGSRNIPVGTLVKCTKFVQRDMDKTALGFKKCETAYEDDVPMIIDYGEGLTCGTGDNFVQDINKELDIIDVFDMEAYALAKVCYRFKIPFTSYKYITDNANDDAPSDWQKNLKYGIKEFEKILNEDVN